MNANVFKTDTIYVTRHELNHNPTTEEAGKRKQFMDSHDFSVTVDPKTNKLEIKVIEKNES